MPNTMTTPLSDGGYLTSYLEDVPDTAYDKLHVQKYAATGAAVGAEFVATEQANLAPGLITALDNGGYVVTSATALRGYYYTGSVFDAAASKLTTLDLPGSGFGFQIVASSHGGFLVQSRDIAAYPDRSPDYNGAPLLTLYDDTGAVVMPTAHLTGSDITVIATTNGDYAVSWTDGNLHHDFVLDPQAPPNLSPPAAAPTILAIFDDANGTLRPATNGTVDDTSPIVRVAVTQPGFVQLSLVEGRGAEDPHLLGGVAVTAEDLARGYVDITVSGFPAPSTLYAHYKSEFGVPGPASTTALTITGDPPILSASDDAGASTGLVADGGVTDDATPTLHLKLTQTAAHVGDVLTLFDAGSAVAQVTLTGDDISRGSIDLTTATLANGLHHLQSGLADEPPSAFSYTLDIEAGGSGPASGQALTSNYPGSSLTGGAGADTLTASEGLDTLTGGGGADVFAFPKEPWAPIHIADFTLGTDRLDLSSLFRASGYSGADPVADHYIYFESDGAGGTVIRFDHDGTGANPQWPNTIIDLEHVATSGLSWSQLAGVTSGPTAAGSPGEALASTTPGSSLAGGAGADTLTASEGLDTLTGGAGADVFAFSREPWAPIHITDFTPGEDKLDLSALFRTAGYSGSDPIGDHYMYVESDGAGGSVLRFDHDGGGPNPQWPNTIIDLEHVAPAQVSSTDWIIH
jgi:hypothetical protein